MHLPFISNSNLYTNERYRTHKIPSSLYSTYVLTYLYTTAHILLLLLLLLLKDEAPKLEIRLRDACIYTLNEFIYIYEL